MWFTNGCFFSFVGINLSQRNLKSIPAARTLGKSPQYVAFYIDEYKIQMKKTTIQLGVKWLYRWRLNKCVFSRSSN